MSDEHRTKIGNSQILKCLIEHATGQREMSASQVTAGLGLLKKVLPDLTAVEQSGSVEVTHLNSQVDRTPRLTRDEWLQIEHKPDVAPTGRPPAQSH